jgi:hypothetical protein
MADKKATVTIQPQLAIRPLTSADITRVALVNSTISLIAQERNSDKIVLITYSAYRFSLKVYDGTPVAVLMGDPVFLPDMRERPNIVSPHFFALDLFIDGGDPIVVYQAPTPEDSMGFRFFNAKAAATMDGSARPMHAFKHWSLAVRNPDGGLTTLLSIDDEELGNANTRALQAK